MHDPLWLEQAGRAARRLAEENFDRDKLADQLIRVLQSSVDGSQESPEMVAPGQYGH